MSIESEKFNFVSNDWREPLHINLKNIDGDITIDGGITFLGFLKVKIESMNVT
jgi:hypothetical protein